MLARAAIVLLIFVAADIFDFNQCRAQEMTMGFDAACRSSMQGGMAGYRQCIYENRLKQIERMEIKTCSKRKYYYKLLFVGRVRRSITEPSDDANSYINIFRWSEFLFIDGESFETGNSEFPFGRLLIDETDEPTIIGQCTGNGCTDLYYVRGAHRLAKMYGPFGSDYRHTLWVLELPR